MLHIYSFDPGLTTGWAHISVKDDEVSLFRHGQCDHYEIGDMLLNLNVSQAVNCPDITLKFVCESFQMTPAKSPAPWSLETIGLIRYWANKYGIELKMYAPSEHKSLVSNDVIKRAGFWVPGQQHAMDAARLSIYYLIKECGLLKWSLLKNMPTKSG